MQNTERKVTWGRLLLATYLFIFLSSTNSVFPRVSSLSSDVVFSERVSLFPDQENKTRQIRQFHFHGWPEVGIPTDGKGMINIIAAVQKQQQQSGNHPITVHCR